MKRHIDKATYLNLVGAAAELLAPYFIGFVNFPEKNGQVDAEIGGSGTLVSIGDTKGVLTAGHVICSIMKNEEVGIVCPSKAHQRITFETQYCMPIELLGDEGSKGPDLGFLVLPPNITSALKATMSFYNLTKHADRMLNKPPPLDNGFWGIAGFAHEHTIDAETAPKGFDKAKIFKGSFMGSVLNGEEEREGFDYVKCEALYNEHYEGPDSFQGFSGGGLWQLIVDIKKEKPDIREQHLIGVAFYETDKVETPEGPVRHIICHGKKSLYQMLPNKIDA